MKTNSKHFNLFGIQNFPHHLNLLFDSLLELIVPHLNSKSIGCISKMNHNIKKVHFNFIKKILLVQKKFDFAD